MGLNEVFKKVADIERNATELASEKVELALTDKLKAELKKYTALVSQSGKDLDNYYVAIRTLEKAINELKGNSGNVTKIAQDLRKQEDLVSNEIDIVTKKIKETNNDLGIKINITELVDLSALQSSNTLSSNIQNDANAYLKYVNTLQKPTI
jgi:biotin-(acetyl-CoA carboxylase) ligase